MNAGRPLRFLAIVLCGWSGVRGIDLYRRGGSVTEVLRAPLRDIAETVGVPRAAAALSPWPQRATTASPVPGAAPRATLSGPPPVVRRASAPAASTAPSAQTVIPAAPEPRPTPALATVAPLLSPAVLPPAILATGPRLAGSAWLIVRNGAAIGVPGGQLGASQAGLRVTYALGDRRRLALAARVSAPMSGRGREAAIGIDWQPTRAPVHVVAEHRIALDGGRGGPMIGIVGGFGPVAAGPGVTVEGYGQAGVIARGTGEAFADGALRIGHPLGALGPVDFDVGLGGWGGAQRGASRLDAGPSLGAVVRLGRGTVRLAADWRERVAGSARPGSGPALSIGTNF